MRQRRNGLAIHIDYQVGTARPRPPFDGHATRRRSPPIRRQERRHPHGYRVSTP